MTWDPGVTIALISAVTAIILGFFKLLVEIRNTHDLVNSRMTELLELTRVEATARGKLDQEQIHQDPQA